MKETEQVSKTLYFNTKLMWLVTHNDITRIKPQNMSLVTKIMRLQ